MRNKHTDHHILAVVRHGTIIDVLQWIEEGTQCG